MRTTVTIDDALYEQALEMADPDMDKANIFREAMKTFVRVQAAKRLIWRLLLADSLKVPIHECVG